MEVASKQLHRHTTPIIVLATGLMIVTAITFNQYLAISGSVSGSKFMRAVSGQALEVKPSKTNKVGHVQISDYLSTKASTAPALPELANGTTNVQQELILSTLSQTLSK